MKPIVLTLVAATVGLAGCSGSEDAGGEGKGVAAKQEAPRTAAPAPDVPRPDPGLYKTTVTMTGLEIPGLPPGMEGHGAGLTTTRQDCLTDADLARGYEELVKKGQDGECAYESFAAAGGKVDAVLVCTSQGRTSRMAMTGTTTKTGAELSATTALEFEGMGKGRMTFTTSHERVGACPAR